MSIDDKEFTFTNLFYEKNNLDVFVDGRPLELLEHFIVDRRKLIKIWYGCTNGGKTTGCLGLAESKKTSDFGEIHVVAYSFAVLGLIKKDIELVEFDEKLSGILT